MKGGKEGRKRRAASGGAARQGRGAAKAKKGGAKRQEGGAPKKGSRKKSFGAVPASEDE
jgi:hypothetical protein